MDKIDKTDQEWKELLTPDEYHVCREKGTERAFTGAYWDEKQAGTYHCRCCQTPLFDSGTKYDSGSGWPSFYRPIDSEVIAEEYDNSAGMVRVEVMCKRCGCHLGHVFEDGPDPTGLRYCINSLSIKLEPKNS